MHLMTDKRKRTQKTKKQQNLVNQFPINQICLTADPDKVGQGHYNHKMIQDHQNIIQWLQ